MFISILELNELIIGFLCYLSKWYSLMNMRQLHILFNEAKTWHWIVCWFLWIYLFLPVFAWCAHKIVLFWSAEQFNEHIMQKLVKRGKFTEINIKSDVKFWLHWIKFGAVSYLLICTNWPWLEKNCGLFLTNSYPFTNFRLVCKTLWTWWL